MKNLKPHQFTRMSAFLFIVLSNLFGTFLAVYYFANLQRMELYPLMSSNVQMTVAGILVVILSILGSMIIRLWTNPLWRWYQAAMDHPSVDPAPEALQIKALDYPYHVAKVNLLTWFLAGLICGALNSFEVEIRHLSFGSFLEVFIGISVISGPVTAVLLYFMVERAWRQVIPLFFVGGDPTRVSAFRLRIRTRVLILFFLGTLPLILLSILSYSLYMSGLDPAALKAHLLLLVLILGGGGILLAVILARMLGASLVEPVEGLAPRLEAVQDSKQVESVPVTSNDEIGELTSHFNQMVLSLNRRAEELDTIYHISHEISNNLEIDQTLQSILEQVREIIPYDGGEICLYDKTNNVLRVRAWTSSAKVITDTRGRAYILGEGYTGWVGAERKSLLIPDVDAHEGHKPTVRQIADGVFLNGYLGVPLLVGQKMVGTLEVVSTKKGFFNEHTRQILEIIAPQAAIAIANAEQVIERERNLKAQIEQLKIEIDQVKRNKQVSEITETGFFQKLKEDARRMRRETRGDE